MRGRHRFVALVGLAIVLTVTMATIAGASTAAAPPVGPLPIGSTSTIRTQVGQLVAFALPHRPNGRVWRIARPFNSRRSSSRSAKRMSGANVVLIFKARGKGTTTVSFGLTRGEQTKAYEARRFVVSVK